MIDASVALGFFLWQFDSYIDEDKNLYVKPNDFGPFFAYLCAVLSRTNASIYEVFIALCRFIEITEENNHADDAAATLCPGLTSIL